MAPLRCAGGPARYAGLSKSLRLREGGFPLSLTLLPGAGYSTNMAIVSLREAIRRARTLGASVEPKHRTGELVFSHASAGRVVISARRKDASRAVVSFLRSLPKRQESPKVREKLAPLPPVATPLKLASDFAENYGKTEEDMAVRKLKHVPKASSKKSKLLSEPKVLKIVATMGADPQEFIRLYRATGGRTAAVTDDMREAVSQWMKDKDWAALMDALGTKNRQTASAAISRVIEQGGA